jgi:hypothetical protein
MPVQSKFSELTRRSMLPLAAIAVIAVAAAPSARQFRKYPGTVAWHLTHGNHVAVGDRRVTLPLLWSKVETGSGDTVVLARAARAPQGPLSEIRITPRMKATAAETDQDELALTQKLNRLEQEKSIPGWSASVVAINASQTTLHCNRDAVLSEGAEVLSMLDCGAANVPYLFSYSGPPESEKEAQAILATLE